jgi:protein-glutamine gamma-glutamyltransferase
VLNKLKNFKLFFKTVSYLVVFFGFLSIWISGSFGLLTTTVFLLVIILSWFLEESRWQISERTGIVLIFFVVPLFYIAWKYQIIGFALSESALAGLLARMILILAAVKLLQKKSDKDWIFLYLISFFEVLLAAGLSISPLYLASFVLYLLATICAVIAFEIRKTSREVWNDLETGQKSVKENEVEDVFGKTSILHLPVTSFLLLLIMISVAVPMFFTLPRVGGAGLGSSSNGLSGFTGFSDSVQLGAIGQLKQNDAVVMRVRLDKISERNIGNLHWRGVALDSFDNKTWKKSEDVYVEAHNKGERDVFQIDYTTNRNDLTVQTVYLEPIDSSVLFALARPVALQGNFQTLIEDSEGAISSLRPGFERVTYKVYSDQALPNQTELRTDNGNYSAKDYRYLEIPDNLDERIPQLAQQLTEKTTNRYDKAKLVESYLQNNFGYTLELKASGEQPLADFLFNIREGHCEYFATAMAVMLRTQGIATRIVNGFQEGEYNETADVYVVRQKNAHSWVEVYFPEKKAWIAFDPTPFAGQNDGTTTMGMLGKFDSYVEALEMFWIQYFVSFDNQEQRSLFRSFKTGFSEYQAKTSDWLHNFQLKLSDWWKEARGDEDLQTSAKAIGFGIAYLIAGISGIIFLVWLYRKIRKLNVWQNLFVWLKSKNETTIIEFYERMQKVLASKGFARESHQTPLEFAFALQMPEALKITEKYNRVRFGEKDLSKDEAEEIENWLKELENN